MRGIDIRQSGGTVLVRVGIDDASGNALSTGTTTVRVCEYQADGTLKQLDFGTGFVLRAPGATFLTPTSTMTAQAAPDGVLTSTGLWDFVLTAPMVANFTVGNVYVVFVTHSALTNVVIRREWQFGGSDGDLVVSATGQVGPDFTNVKQATAPTNLANLTVGPDFTNVKQATAPTTLTNITIPVTSAITDKVNYGLSAGERTALAAAILTDTTDTLGAAIVAIKVVTDHLATGLQSDGAGGYQFTTTALVHGPSGGGGLTATALWTELLSNSDFNTTNSVGAAFKAFLTATPVAVDGSGRVILQPSGLDAIVVETGVNARQSLSPILAASAGVLSGAGSGTIVIRGGNVGTTRITATTDNAGNRSSVTLALPS